MTNAQADSQSNKFRAFECPDHVEDRLWSKYECLDELSRTDMTLTFVGFDQNPRAYAFAVRGFDASRIKRFSTLSDIVDLERNVLATCLIINFDSPPTKDDIEALGLFRVLNSNVPVVLVSSGSMRLDEEYTNAEICDVVVSSPLTAVKLHNAVKMARETLCTRGFISKPDYRKGKNTETYFVRILNRMTEVFDKYSQDVEVQASISGSRRG
jgi:hypothetical protein